MRNPFSSAFGSLQHGARLPSLPPTTALHYTLATVIPPLSSEGEKEENQQSTKSKVLKLKKSFRASSKTPAPW